MRCLVTGASGHLGSYLTEKLVREGAEVSVLVRPQSDLWRLAEVVDLINVVRADLSGIDQASPAIADAKPEAVFHLGWQGVTRDFKDDPAQLTVNVAGSLKLFDTVRAAGCRLWIGLGSQAEYGPSGDVLSEDTPALPVTAYGAGKLQVGLMTRTLCEQSGIRYVWLRLLATYGPKDDERHMLPSVIRKLLKGERPQLTAGGQEWDYLYVKDAAEAIYQTAVNEGANGVFNLGSGKSRTVRSILECVRNKIDPSLALGFGEIPYPPDQPMRLATTIDRLREATGWKPAVDLDEGLNRTIAWYRAHSPAS